MRSPRLLATVTAATLALGLLAGIAQARVVTLAKAGSWEAFGGTSNNGTPTCGMSSSGSGLWFGVKYFKGETGFTVQLSSTKWTLKDGVKVKVTMQFDRESPWSATATGFHMSDGDAALEFQVPRNKLGLWLREFRAANTLIVGFPDEGKVNDWRVSLAGTTAVSTHMVNCIDRM